MVTIEQIQRGVSKYVEEQMLPHMQGKDKWMVAGIATLYLSKLPGIMVKLREKEMINVLGLFDDEGKVDAEMIINSIKPVARSTPASFDLPFSNATITLKAEDLDMILRYITQM